MFFATPGFLTPASAATFEFGNALQFDGVNDTVTLPDINTAGGSLSSLSISFWAIPNTANKEVFFGTGSQSTFIFSIQMNLSTLFIYPRSGSNQNVSVSGLNSLNGNWTHFFIVYNGNAAEQDRIKVWINGSEQSVTYGNGFPATSIAKESFSNVILGRWGHTVSQFYSNKMDEFAIWTSVVGTNQNAVDLYNGGNGTFANEVISNPERYYRFNQTGTDSTLIDSTPNGNNGTLNNFTLPGAWVTH